MKKCFIRYFAACMVIMPVFAGHALSTNKVLVIPGVSEESAIDNAIYLFVYEGIKEALGKKGIVPEFHHVELDVVPDEAARIERGEKVVEIVKQSRPDVVIVLNDNAVKYVGTHIDDVPVVFAWIFGDPKSLGLPKANVTGVTRRSYAPDIWRLAKQLMGINTVALISKNNFSMAGVREGLIANADALEKQCGVRVTEMYLCDTFEEWQKQVQNFPSELIYLADTSRIQDGDRQMTSQELTRWTVDNAKVPVIAANERDVAAGALFAIVTSEKEIGRQAGNIALEILGGKAVSEIPIQESGKGKLVFNTRTAQKMNLDISYEILSTADKVYQ